MNPDDALETIRRLAEGIDPETGEFFDEDSPYQRPMVIRALFAAVTAMERDVQRQARKRSQPERAGKPWDDAETDTLVRSFDQGVSVADLARRHRRTRGAVIAQLVKLGKMSDQALPAHAHGRRNDTPRTGRGETTRYGETPQTQKSSHEWP